MRIELSPIGIVRNDIKEARKFEAENVVSDIDIFPEYLEALDSIESFSHIMIIFWLHKIRETERSIRKVHPRNNSTLPLSGVFATRSPVRPNPIGITTVKLLERKANILRVSGLDAIDGTPVLDIKPHLPENVSGDELKLPAWVTKCQSNGT